jgi:SWI/SNF-related matrix-associated actin-dependent regulator of chromatin subfamily A-like protein 1
MLELIERKRRVVDAVTDGRSQAEEAVVEGVIRALRDSRPARHLRAVG